MSSKDDRKKRGRQNAEGPNPSNPSLRARGEMEDRLPPQRQTFAGPRQTGEPLRLNLARDAYAELVAHAKADLSVEVCGVLVGRQCVDDEGEHVAVAAIIRGEAAREGGAHVTFTQETWNRIHDALDREFPNMEIVGWYHTHPGFGVVFSEMDQFIHRNFFAGRNQVALVTDPLGGDEAVCVNEPDGIRYLARFWVDGRERTLRRPFTDRPPGISVEAAGSGEVLAGLRAIEERLAQTARMIEEHSAAQYRMVATLGFFCALVVVGFIVYSIYRQVTVDVRPPERVQFAEIPVRVGDETYMMGVDVVRWRVPEAMMSSFVQAIKKMIAEEEARQKNAESAASPPPRPDVSVPAPTPPTPGAP